MADESTSTWSDLLREAKGPLVEALRYKTVLLSELRRDHSPTRWHGKQVTVPMFLSPQQGTAMISETGATATLPVPQAVDTTQAAIKSATIAIAISFTEQLYQQNDSGDGGWAEVLPTKMERAENVFSRVINEQMCGTGALLASCTGANNNSTTVTVGTSANFYQLYPGRVIDVLTRSSGAAVGASTAIKISSINRTAGTLVVSTALTTSTNEGIYIQGSWGNALAGFGDAVAVTGTFQGVDKAAKDAWQGTDVTPSAVTDPTITILDTAERRSMERSGGSPAFYIADPAVVDKYSQGLTVQARWSGETGELKSGWTGVRYRDKLLIPEFDMPAQTIYGINTDDVRLYTLMDGPNWDDLDGSMFRRFGRSLPVEAWLVWMLQLGFHRCNSQVKIGNMTRAA